MNRTIRPYGERALLVELDALHDVLALHAALAAEAPAGVVDIVPAARTVTVVVDPRVLRLEVAQTWIAHAEPVERDDPDDAVIELDVEYSGDDLDEVSRLTGMPVEQVIQEHTSSTWRVAFGGFAPGFGYLVTDHDRLRVPRRATPRTSVPAGSVALAGEFTGVYPRSGPGGWQLIGRTDVSLWDETRDPPALLRPGVRVRFRDLAGRAVAGRGAPSVGRGAASGGRGAVPGGRGAPERSEDASRDRVPDVAGLQARAHASLAPRPTGAPRAPDPAASLTIVEPGMQLLVEDLGRAGNASIGAGRSGALDRAALRLANRLLGNAESAAALEVLFGGTRLRFERPTWFAVTGARGSLTLGRGEDGDDAVRIVEPDVATRASAGETLCISHAVSGMRYVVGVRGGIRAPVVLGSCSRDIGADLGPAPLQAGDRLAVGDEPSAGIPPVDALTVPQPPVDTVVVHVRPGPREHWFSHDSLAHFYDTEWRVSTESNRIGARLTPAEGEVRLRRAVTDELPSEAMLPGAIQVPPAGIPVVLLADHPVTGGYPVIAVVADGDLDVFAQLRPGQGVRFRHVR